MTISPPIKILALIGVVAVVGFGASTMLLGHSSSPARTSTAQAHSGRIVHHVPPTVAAPTTPKPHATATPAARGNLVYEDLPAPLQWELARHKVVVVNLYNPNADVDAISVAEAHAGAVDANAGYLLVSVLNNAVAGMLTALLPGGGLLPDPGVLVYRAPGDIMVRLDGFADRATVAQAVTNALADPKSIIATTSTTSATPASGD
jgi:hypothetical protein